VFKNLLKNEAKVAYKMLMNLSAVRGNGHLGQADPNRLPLLPGVGPSLHT